MTAGFGLWLENHHVATMEAFSSVILVFGEIAPIDQVGALCGAECGNVKNHSPQNVGTAWSKIMFRHQKPETVFLQFSIEGITICHCLINGFRKPRAIQTG
ncbi:MAG: hypothetical protein HQL69_21995 [Magnetococcales bacterium]|nr:hypothetical protein [Magnetococcales bacterium]